MVSVAIDCVVNLLVGSVLPVVIDWVVPVVAG